MVRNTEKYDGLAGIVGSYWRRELRFISKALTMKNLQKLIMYVFSHLGKGMLCFTYLI